MPPKDKFEQLCKAHNANVRRKRIQSSMDMRAMEMGRVDRIRKKAHLIVR